MGLFDKAKDLAEEHGDKVADGVDKATDLVDDKTGGKYHDQLEKVDDTVRDKLDDEPDPPKGSSAGAH